MAQTGELKDAVELLQVAIEDFSADGTRLRSEVRPDDELAAHLLQRLFAAIENARGCLVLAGNSLPIPTVTVTRSIFESFLAVNWATLSDVNGQVVMDASRQELIRIVRNLVKDGRATMINRTTGGDATTAFLDHPAISEAKRPERFDKMADEGGVANVYDMLYPFLSAIAHGTVTNLFQHFQKEEFLSSIVDCARVSLAAIHLITANRICYRKATTRDELVAIFRVRLTV